MTHSYSGISPAEFEIINQVALRRSRARGAVADETNERYLIKLARQRIAKAVPRSWRDAVDASIVHNEKLPWWERDADVLRRLGEFECEHGASLDWNLDDYQICEKAKKIADSCVDMTASIAPNGAPYAVKLTDVERLERVLMLCKLVGVDAPGALTIDGAVARGCSDLWWRRAIRKKVSRVIELGAIKLGLVTKWRGGYCSDGAVKRRGEQLLRNEAMLKKTLIRNEAGQVYNLHELASLSVSNPENRRGELMTRIRGCEEYADSVGHVSAFYTLTAPSKFHAVSFGKNGNLRPNRHYGKLEGDDTDCSPRGAQVWLRTMWARARAELHRKGVRLYGFRVGEPHHDGTPHWHALFWFKTSEDAAIAETVIRESWLSEYGNENGALQHRVKAVAIDRTKGSAAGYIAKYIAKNIGADFDINTEGHSKKTAYTAKRVDAWAATWGIRQFQSIGLPSVTVWRCLRGVDSGQADAARVSGEPRDRAAWMAHAAAHKSGDIGACFRRFMLAMGGVCRSRGDWALQVAKRVNPSTNGYGEKFDKKTAVGVIMPSGGWLVSKKIQWSRVANDVCDAQIEVPDSVEGLAARARLAAPWTRFNNCTARLTGDSRRQLFGKYKRPWLVAMGLDDS
jgi:Bacteriophage replication gene A protein (GPA)